MAIRIYLDNCCVNRPFDAHGQPRVRAEALAIEAIVAMHDASSCRIIAGIVSYFEAGRAPDSERREGVLAVLDRLEFVKVASGAMRGWVEPLVNIGIKPMDAYHIAFAKEAGASALLTCDDGILRKANGIIELCGLPVYDPVLWLRQHQGASHEYR